MRKETERVHRILVTCSTPRCPRPAPCRGRPDCDGERGDRDNEVACAAQASQAISRTRASSSRQPMWQRGSLRGASRSAPERCGQRGRSRGRGSWSAAAVLRVTPEKEGRVHRNRGHGSRLLRGARAAFSLFVTTKEVGQAPDLASAACRGIVEAAGGASTLMGVHMRRAVPGRARACRVADEEAGTSIFTCCCM